MKPKLAHQGTIYAASGQISNNPPISHIPPKPVFIMRFRNSMSDTDFINVKDTIWQSDLNKDYHIIVIKNDKDKDEFEMYNADKIEKQDWNTLVNKMIK